MHWRPTLKFYFCVKEAQRFMLIRNERWQKTQLSPTPPMDGDEIRYLSGTCFHSKYYFYEVFAADNFPKLTREGFIIVNTSPAQYEGSHWMVILFHGNKIYSADPLGIPIQNYHILYCRQLKNFNEVTQKIKLKPIQNQNSKLKTQNVELFAFISCMWCLVVDILK